VQVVKVERDRQIVLRWASAEEPDATGSRETTVTMAFEGLDDGRTLVSITEEGWRPTPQGLKSSYSNCEGWTQMLCALKVYVEHGINLRAGFYR
jgi:uncharacterized protein YndB with AHSA1/START domain